MRPLVDFLVSATTTFESSIMVVLIAMAVITAIEAPIPLHARGSLGRAHVLPNLALTFITFATNFVVNTALVLTLIWLQSIRFGFLYQFELHPLATLAIAVLALDFSFYVNHVAMHKIPGFWHYHRVHHSDAHVDVTTTIRQHPGEGVIRYAFLTAGAIATGATPGAFAVYRLWSILSGLLEHANVRLPQRLDTLLSLVIISPNMHKIHHSRDTRYTDTNFGNVISVWDRLFLTFVPAAKGMDVNYGLEGFDVLGWQTIAGFLAVPFRDTRKVIESAAKQQA